MALASGYCLLGCLWPCPCGAAAVVIAYTLLGGLVGDIITDVIQGGVLAVPLILAIALGAGPHRFARLPLNLAASCAISAQVAVLTIGNQVFAVNGAFLWASVAGLCVFAAVCIGAKPRTSGQIAS